MEEARIRREVGTGSLSDVLNFEVGVNAARSEVISARRQQHEATAGLAALLGFPAGRLPDGMVPAALAPETTAEMTIPEADAEIAYALARRPDLTQRAEALQAAEAGLGAARSGFWPTVRLAASLDGDRANDGRLRRDDFGDSVTLSLSYTLFAGGYHRARVAEARQNQAAATKELESRRQGVAAEIVQALADIEASTEQLRLQRRNAELVQRHRDLVEKEYAVGQVSLVRLNEAQRNLVQAQGRLAQARVALQQARFTLDTATGRSLERFALRVRSVITFTDDGVSRGFHERLQPEHPGALCRAHDRDPQRRGLESGPGHRLSHRSFRCHGPPPGAPNLCRHRRRRRT
jgi:outer membrane protein TolC